MSALWLPRSPQLRPMLATDLETVLAVERLAYPFPWTHGNFIDSLAAGYHAELLVDGADDLIGYFVAMAAVDELHLLNLTVAPPRQGQGHGCTLLDALEQRCRTHRLPMLWLEVRASNERARQIYRRRGFVDVGLRRHYYPAAQGLREDAVVMRLAVPGGAA